MKLGPVKEDAVGRTNRPGAAGPPAIAAVRVVPPHGLCLEEVRYPAPGQLAARAALTRQVRVTQDTGG